MEVLSFCCGHCSSVRDCHHPPSPAALPCRYNLAHRGYTSEGPGGHAACPFDFYKTWAAAPAKTRALSEALTRDAGEVTGAEDLASSPSRDIRRKVLLHGRLASRSAPAVVQFHLTAAHADRGAVHQLAFLIHAMLRAAADSPADATCADIAPMPPSRLAQVGAHQPLSMCSLTSHSPQTARLCCTCCREL